MAQLASFDDAFGWMLLDHLDGRAMTAWLECDDGRSQPALGPEVFFANEDDWPAVEHEALAFVSGRVLDIGCGAGRHALHLQSFGRSRAAPAGASTGSSATATSRRLTRRC